MLYKLSVGPPMVGAADLKSFAENTAKKDFKGSGSESSFGKALEEKLVSQNSSSEPKEAKDTLQKDVREKEIPDTPEAKDKKAEAEVATLDGKSKNANGRQQAIKDFMDSFESEFEIPPTRLVEAMAQLDDTQLAQSPEDTAQAVVAELGLDEADSEKAQVMYASLLVQLKQMPVAKPVSEMVVGAGLSRQNTQARIMAAQGKQDMAVASVDRLNKNFWRVQAKPVGPQQVPMPSLEQGQEENLEIDESSFVPEPGKRPSYTEAPPPARFKELPPHLQGQMSDSISPRLLVVLAAKQGAASDPELMEEFQQALQAPPGEKAPVVARHGPQAVAPKMNAEQFQNYSQGQSFAQQNQQEFTAKAPVMSKEMSKEPGSVTQPLEVREFSQSLTGLEGLDGAPIKVEALKTEMAAPAAVGAAAIATPAEQDIAVKQVINQAQYLIKKGGGEMKVEMTPEGMGTIHLKVVLQDGKVNMQMSADTREAKKIIESSLAELKTSLAAQKLSMENVKVDVVGNISADTATQNQTNLSNGQGQQHKETRQFWNQFNENFGSQDRRESLTGMPNLRGYGQKDRDPLQPVDVATQSRRVEGKGSGLNLVA